MPALARFLASKLALAGSADGDYGADTGPDVKIGLMLYLTNDRESNSKQPYETIRAVAPQADVARTRSVGLTGGARRRRGIRPLSRRPRRCRQAVG
jgi:hypothetical protein